MASVYSTPKTYIENRQHSLPKYFCLSKLVQFYFGMVGFIFLVLLPLQFKLNIMQNKEYRNVMLKPLPVVSKPSEMSSSLKFGDAVGAQMDKLADFLKDFSHLLQDFRQNFRSSTQSAVSHLEEPASKTDQSEARFQELKYDIENINCLKEEQRMDKILLFSSDLARNILTKSFIWFEDKKLNDQKLRHLFCNNYIANIMRYAYQNRLSKDELKKMDEHLRKNVFSFLQQRYPQNESKMINLKFNNMIKLVDNFQSNAVDLVFESRIKFQYKVSGDYSKEIMQFINYLLRLTRDKVIPGANVTAYQIFEKKMQMLFQKAQDQEWVDMALSDHPTFDNKDSKLSQDKNSQQKVELEDEEIVRLIKSNKYVEKKEYNKYLIGQKISDSVPEFSAKDIEESILRILIKWCEQLEKCFEETNINSRDERFRMADGSQKFVNKQLRKQLYGQLCKQKIRLDQFLSVIQSNIYENIKYMVDDAKCFTAFRDFASQDEGLAGYIATVMKKCYENYTISYLNKLIHCILTAQKNVKGKQDKKKKTKVDINLITFKVGDLMRCKFTSKESQILAIYNYLISPNRQGKERLEVIRTKNRLSQSTRDILINLRYNNKMVVEMQLSITSETSNFIKCSSMVKHFLYEIERATFGPFSQICHIYSNSDPRAEFFTKRFQVMNESGFPPIPPYSKYLSLFKDQIAEQSPLKNAVRSQSSCKHRVVSSVLPVWCFKCQKFSSSLILIEKHDVCLLCDWSICSACKLQKRLKQSKHNKQHINKNWENQIKYEQIAKAESTKQKEAGFSVKKIIKVIDFKKKFNPYSQIYLVFFNSKVYFFQSSKKKIATILCQTKNQKQFKKFLSQLKIVGQLEVQQDFLMSSPICKILIQKQINETNKKYKKSFVLQNLKIKDKYFAQYKCQTVEKLIMQNVQLQQIDCIANTFPNINIAVFNGNQLGLKSELDSLEKWQNNLRELILASCNLFQLNDNFCKLTNLEQLVLTKNRFHQFPLQVTNLSSIKSLSLSSNLITEITPQIKQMINLKYLKMNDNHLQYLPQQIGQLVNLKAIDFARNRIRKLSDSFHRLESLEKIQFDSNKICNLQDNVFQKMVNLRYVDFSANSDSYYKVGIWKIPLSFKNKAYLSYINFQKNFIKKIDAFVFQLPNLTQLNLSYNKICQIEPFTPPKPPKLKSMILIRNSLEVIPPSILLLKSLQKLDLSQNPASLFPQQTYYPQTYQPIPLGDPDLSPSPLCQYLPSVCLLKKLKELTLNKLNIKRFPKFKDVFVKQCLKQNIIKDILKDEIDKMFENLEIFDLRDNFIKKLGNQNKIGDLRNSLKELYLSNNQIIKLPRWVYEIKKLQVLQVNNNMLTYFYKRHKNDPYTPPPPPPPKQQDEQQEQWQNKQSQSSSQQQQYQQQQQQAPALPLPPYLSILSLQNNPITYLSVQIFSIEKLSQLHITAQNLNKGNAKQIFQAIEEREKKNADKEAKFFFRRVRMLQGDKEIKA